MPEDKTGIDHNVKAKRALDFIKKHGGDTERFDYFVSLIDNTYDDGYSLGFKDGGATVKAILIETLKGDTKK